LPDWRLYPEFPARAERESAFNKLHGALDRNFASNSDQQMEMIRHDYKFMQTVLVLRPIFVQSSHEQLGGAGGLE